MYQEAGLLSHIYAVQGSEATTHSATDDAKRIPGIPSKANGKNLPPAVDLVSVPIHPVA